MSVLLDAFLAADVDWNDMKPKSGALEHSGLKWERVKVVAVILLVCVNI